jgi:hypothetical protein
MAFYPLSQSEISRLLHHDMPRSPNVFGYPNAGPDG